MGANSPEWAISFLGTILHNNVASGVYTTNGKQACEYQAQHSQAQAVVVDSLDRLKLYLKIIDKLEVKVIVVYGVNQIPDDLRNGGTVFTFNEFLNKGKEVPDAVIEQTEQLIKPGHCAVLIYTSGTTGQPKGVMLSNDNIIFNSRTICIEFYDRNFSYTNVSTEDFRTVSYLPLSHIAGLIYDLIFQLIWKS